MQERYNTFSSQYDVAIPIIQRDYVQGAEQNYEKRNLFISSLLNALLEDRAHEMDFIFGSTDSNNGAKPYFIPVDGQQRLTTLALLGWLLNQKCGGRYADSLGALTYTTRPSTEQFCKELRQFYLPTDYKTISEYIKTEPGWFSDDWLTDPSINAMLDFLDYTDMLLRESPYTDNVEDMAERFFSQSPIMFDLLDMKALNLNDDLYIKMNARGKLLTPFENWKAEFEGYLKDHFSDVTYPYGRIPGEDESPTIREYFEYAIEHEWCDMLWPIAYERWSKLSDDEKRTVIYPRIDESFMNLLNFISRFLFYSSYSESQLDDMVAVLKSKVKGEHGENWYRRLFEHEKDKTRLTVYESVGNVTLLFRILDALVKMQQVFGDFMSFLSLLFVSTNSSQRPDSVKVNLYDSSSVDLVSACLDNDLEYFTEITLWAVLRWIVVHQECLDKDADMTATIDYLRIIVGWARSRNQRLTNGLNVGINLRVTHYQEADEIITSLVDADNLFQGLMSTSQQSIADEREKGRLYGTPKFEIIRYLSPCRALYYCFNLLMPAILEIEDSQVDEFISRFYDFMALNDADRIHSLVSHGFNGVKTALSGFYFYGLRGKWDYIFTLTPTDVSFQSTSAALIGSMFKKPETEYTAHSLQYYIINYPDFIEARNNVRWRDVKTAHYLKQKHWWEVWAVKTFSSNPLQGYNVDPYAFVVQQLYDGSALDLWSESEYSDHGMLWIKARSSDHYDLTMECKEQGWRINSKDKRGKASKAFLKRFSESVSADGAIEYTDTEGVFAFEGDVLCDLPGTDRILTALSLINALDALL